MLMSIGQFVFSLDTLAYQDYQRQTQWRHPSNARVGANPARQFAGKGDDTINLSGQLFPELAGSVLSLDELRKMADTGKAWPLIEGSGKVQGLFVIESLSDGRSLFFKDGTPRQLNFQITLQRAAEDRGTVPAAR